MDAAVHVVSVVAIAVVELWIAVPAGIAMGLAAPLVWVATLGGALLGVALWTTVLTVAVALGAEAVTGLL